MAFRANYPITMAILNQFPEQHPGRIFLIVPAILVGWYIISSVLAWYRLRHIPGPFCYVSKVT